MSQGYITGLGKDARVHGFDGQWLKQSEFASFQGNRGDNGIYIVDDVTLEELSGEDTGYMMCGVFALVPMPNGQGVYLHEAEDVPTDAKALLQEIKALIKDKSHAQLRPFLQDIEEKLAQLNRFRPKEDEVL